MKTYVVSDIKVKPDFTDFKRLIAEKVKVSVNDIHNVKLIKKSIDARHGVSFVLSFTFETNRLITELAEYEEKTSLYDNVRKAKPIGLSPIVVGSGPAGLFCAYLLAKAGLCPVIIEKGGDVQNRIKAVSDFWKSGILDESCNVQFGAGGAGTFSDGKLNTGINDVRIFSVLDLFVKKGAPDSIMYSATPHIGTDNLRIVVNNMINDLQNMGATVMFSTNMTDIVVENNAIVGVKCTNNGKESIIACSDVVLSIGQSAESTVRTLYDRGVAMESKPFSIGVRVEHSRKMIDESQYGFSCMRWRLDSANYKLSTKTSDGRGVYSFCMCPGGFVVAAASEKGKLVTNGMSYSSRNAENSNSAILVSVAVSDYETKHPLSGLDFRGYWEKRAYSYTKSFKAPAQNTLDFINGKLSKSFCVNPSYSCGVVKGELSNCLPNFAVSGIKEGLSVFGKKIKGFDKNGVITAIESRSSSPVRILRGENRQSNILGLFPCGEGAGYAGGIVSAAVDGIKTAEKILEKYY